MPNFLELSLKEELSDLAIELNLKEHKWIFGSELNVNNNLPPSAYVHMSIFNQIYRYDFH